MHDAVTDKWVETTGADQRTRSIVRVEIMTFERDYSSMYVPSGDIVEQAQRALAGSPR